MTPTSSRPQRPLVARLVATMTSGYWEFRSKGGTFRIVPLNGRFHFFFEEEDFGSYHSAVAALEGLLGGYSHYPATRGLPFEVPEWTFVRMG